MIKIRKTKILLKFFVKSPWWPGGLAATRPTFLKASLDILRDKIKLMGPPPNLLLGLLDLFITGVLLLPWLPVSLVNITVVHIKQVGKVGNCDQNRYDVLNIKWGMPLGPLRKFK